MEVPVYLVTGFLDAGKTDFINGVLEDGFARSDRTLLVCCEEGDLEYNMDVMEHVYVVNVEEEEDLTRSFLEDCARKYRPRQVLIEYNGMWNLEHIFKDCLPKNWILYQIMTLVQASTFEIYAKNLGQLMMEKITNADLVIFNRCTPELRDSLRKRNLRMINRRASMYLENVDGTSEDYSTGEECPFDLEQDIIDIPDEDFGVWYVDVMDHPDRYRGKIIHAKLIMVHSKRWGNVACPGRFAMVCCEKDISFLGLLAKGGPLSGFRDRDWMEVTAQMDVEEHPAYQGKGPVLQIQTAVACAKPDPEIVNF